MNFEKYNLNKVSNFINKELVDQISSNINKQIKLLKKDYSFIDLDKSLVKETLLSRALSYRVFDNKLKIIFEKKINSYLSKKFLKKKNQKFIINPFIYIRICKPNEKLIKKYENANFYTEPHYDRSFDGIKFYSLWFPLENTDLETGSLCYFKIPKKLRNKHFPVLGRNKYSMHNYFQSPKNADSLLSNHSKPVYINKGDMLFFNQYCKYKS